MSYNDRYPTDTAVTNTRVRQKLEIPDSPLGY